MTTLVVLAGAVGLILVVTSLPPVAGRGLARRVDPFLHGLSGRPSRLLVMPSSGKGTWLVSALVKLGVVDGPDLVRRLEAAGRAPDPAAFRVEQVVWAGGALLVVVAGSIVATPIGYGGLSPTSALVAAVAAAIGGLGRDWFLTKEIDRRNERLRAELPTAIDHMTLALVAGESIPAAFARVARTAHGVVGDEFERVAGDMRSGVSVLDSLDELRDRMPDPAVARFVDAMCTAVEQGTSLSDVLRAQADDVRDARRRRLLEMGGRREVLMLIPVVFLIMPVVVLFALYPGLVSLDLLVR